jgi:hypothetical protein
MDAVGSHKRWIRGREAKVNVMYEGKIAIDFRQYTIRQLPGLKAFASSLEKTFLHPKESDLTGP